MMSRNLPQKLDRNANRGGTQNSDVSLRVVILPVRFKPRKIRYESFFTSYNRHPTYILLVLKVVIVSKLKTFIMFIIRISRCLSLKMKTQFYTFVNNKSK